LKVAQIARLIGVSRSTASEQQGLSSKEVVQAAHHRMAGRPYGKLLPRYAGPIAEFLITHPKASRLDILDFIEATWKVRVSTVALWKFLKKYGLDRAQRSLASASESPAVAEPQIVASGATPGTALLVPPSEDFFLPRRSTRGRSSSCRPR
jgi:transposase